jgi:hypothetical protein
MFNNLRARFWPDENTREAWGYSFQWTPHHLTPEQMEPMKFTYDKLADECLERLNLISPPHDKALPKGGNSMPQRAATSEETDKQGLTEKELAVPHRDLYKLLEENATKDEKLGELWTEVNRIPEWVDWEQVSRGQDVLYRYGGASLTGLCYQSLLGGMVRRPYRILKSNYSLN